MKRLILLAMAVFLVLGWKITLEDLKEKPAVYRQLVEEGERYEENNIYVRAIETYKKALEYNPESLELELRIAKDYLALGDESSFVSRCNAVNEAHKYPVSAAVLLADYYMDGKRYEKAIDVIQKAKKYHKEEEELEERYEKLKYTYKNLYISFDEIDSFCNGSAVVKSEDMYGLISIKGKNILKCSNTWNGMLSDDGTMIPVFKNEEYYFVNEDGYRVEVPGTEQNIEELGNLYNGTAPARINGKYGYINSKFQEITAFEWDGATVIRDGLGAVKKDGKWALIDDSFQLITDYIYDDVKTDDYGSCFSSERAFVKEAGGYRMVDKKGMAVGDMAYEEAELFSTEQPAAVKVNGKWGFADADGQMVIAPQYENAGSFSNGLAPVQTISGWGYINLANQLAIKDEFMEARSFYEGLAPVKNGNQWTVIELNLK